MPIPTDCPKNRFPDESDFCPVERPLARVIRLSPCKMIPANMRQAFLKREACLIFFKDNLHFFSLSKEVSPDCQEVFTPEVHKDTNYYNDQYDS